MAKASSLLVARESFVGALDGTQFDVKEGDLIEADHPLVAKFPDQFIAPPLRFAQVEQASAAPGEKRAVLHKVTPEPAPAGKAISTSSFKGQ